MFTARTLCCFTLLAALSQSAFADSWKFDPVKKDKIEIYGDIKVIQTVDARKNVQYPDFLLSIYFKNELLAKYKGIKFQRLFASPDRNPPANPACFLTQAADSGSQRCGSNSLIRLLG